MGVAYSPPMIDGEAFYGLRGLFTALVFFLARRPTLQEDLAKMGKRRQVARTPKLLHSHAYYVFVSGAPVEQDH